MFFKSSLPYWNRNVGLEISPWIPYGVDYSPLLANKYYSPSVEKIASLSMSMDSELILIRSFSQGNGGTLFRDHLYDPVRGFGLDPWFTAMFGYSKAMEDILTSVSAPRDDVQVGLTLCEVWGGHILIDECKVLAVVSDVPFFEEEPFLAELEKELVTAAQADAGRMAFFAQEFGYRRCSIAYETDDVVQLAISQALFNISMDATRTIVGPPPELQFPAI